MEKVASSPFPRKVTLESLRITLTAIVAKVLFVSASHLTG